MHWSSERSCINQTCVATRFWPPLIDAWADVSNAWLNLYFNLYFIKSSFFTQSSHFFAGTSEVLEWDLYDGSAVWETNIVLETWPLSICARSFRVFPSIGLPESRIKILSNHHLIFLFSSIKNQTYFLPSQLQSRFVFYIDEAVRMERIHRIDRIEFHFYGKHLQERKNVQREAITGQIEFFCLWNLCSLFIVSYKCTQDTRRPFLGTYYWRGSRGPCAVNCEYFRVIFAESGFSFYHSTYWHWRTSPRPKAGLGGVNEYIMLYKWSSVK